jgi:hypothetical protein
MRRLMQFLAVADEIYMKQVLLTVTILMAVGAAGCKSNSTTPSTSTTTTVATTTTTAPATTTTTSVPVPTTFTMSGLITDDTTSRAVPLAEIEFVEGPNTGKIFHADLSGLYTAPSLTPGAFTMRVRGLGYDSLDVRGILANADLRLDVKLHLTPITTTTTSTIAPTLHADFTWTPDPCTISGSPPVVNCTVDGTTSTPIGSITTYLWSYKSQTVPNNARFMLVLACSDLGSSTSDTVSVTLTVFNAGGTTDTVTKGVPINKINGACP